ncbi:MAG TPA: transglycosylase SLT domain-containing protein [Burkholderiales bacterium]|nr:transglycosylase SLT domain-containing protein [Burkholderiales bacterium]
MVPNQKPLAALAFAAAAVVLLTGRPGVAGAPDLALACEVPVADVVDATEQSPALDAGQQALARWLSRRFLVASEATETIVAAAWEAAGGAGLDPLLVLAVISIESRFNPLAESTMGAKGLMQIIPRFHRAKLAEHGGDHAVLDPESNIRVGALILREYIHRTGTLETGLQFYNGARRDESGLYARKVLAERQRLEQVLRAGTTAATTTGS